MTIMTVCMTMTVCVCVDLDVADLARFINNIDDALLHTYATGDTRAPVASREAMSMQGNGACHPSARTLACFVSATLGTLHFWQDRTGKAPLVPCS